MQNLPSWLGFLLGLALLVLAHSLVLKEGRLCDSLF